MIMLMMTLMRVTITTRFGQRNGRSHGTDENAVNLSKQQTEIDLAPCFHPIFEGACNF
ncbi:hypothetical protein Poly41_45710 [Novipirellula artificiosorum]|uniref:Uncharacterized protein n=1 Tax=Novipirellula artificiosorum TaxID=2528016 RepID=A0A5C6DB76_9BACT|nr:hypothetical protein Poly41_45710 [Novipirellula artificiosorum]